MILTRSTLQFSYLCKNAKDSSINYIICHYFSIVAQLTPIPRSMKLLAKAESTGQVNTCHNDLTPCKNVFRH